MEAEIAQIKIQVAALPAQIVAALRNDLKARVRPEPREAAPMEKKTVDYGKLGAQGATLRFVVMAKSTVFGTHIARFVNQKTIVPDDADKALLPKGATSFPSINAWATAILKKHQAAMGRSTASLNVYDKKSGISYQAPGTDWVPLSNIQTIVRLAAPVAPVPVVAGGGAPPPPAVMPEAQPSLGGGSQGENCELCDQFVEAGETCNCDHIICGKCDAIVDATLGPCHGCGVTLGAECCGAMLDTGVPTCHACSTLADEEAEADGDLVEMAVKGTPCLYQPTTGAVSVRRDNGAPGEKISVYKDGVHKWEWTRKKIAGTFFRVNHFNYVRKTASAGGGWVGVLNTAGEIEVVPEPADGNQ